MGAWATSTSLIYYLVYVFIILSRWKRPTTFSRQLSETTLEKTNIHLYISGDSARRCVMLAIVPVYKLLDHKQLGQRQRL